MEKSTKKLLLFYLAAAALGAALHFLFTWLPNPITALVAPVRVTAGAYRASTCD